MIFNITTILKIYVSSYVIQVCNKIKLIMGHFSLLLTKQSINEKNLLEGLLSISFCIRNNYFPNLKYKMETMEQVAANANDHWWIR